MKILSDIASFWIEFPNVQDFNLRVVKPQDVRIIIEKAHQVGWEPEKKGRVLRFEWDEKQLLI